MALITVTSCKTYTVLNEPNTTTYGNSCPNPEYVGTMSKAVKNVKVVSTPTSGGENKYSTVATIDQESISLYNLLSDAREKYGDNVTIHNVRWDMANKKRISVVYDVIKCKK